MAKKKTGNGNGNGKGKGSRSGERSHGARSSYAVLKAAHAKTLKENAKLKAKLGQAEAACKREAKLRKAAQDEVERLLWSMGIGPLGSPPSTKK
jgi:hypothetical protein